MKYTKSAIGLLTAQYRSVLKKCWLINVGLFALGAAIIPNKAQAAAYDYANASIRPDGQKYGWIRDSSYQVDGQAIADNLDAQPGTGTLKEGNFALVYAHRRYDGETTASTYYSNDPSRTENNDYFNYGQLVADVYYSLNYLRYDAGFLTSHQSLAGYATESWVRSQGYLTSESAPSPNNPTITISVRGTTGSFTLNQSGDKILTFDNVATKGDLNSEASTRSTADTDLSNAIATEASDRATAVSNEATARSNADTALTTRINNILKADEQFINIKINGNTANAIDQGNSFYAATDGNVNTLATTRTIGASIDNLLNHTGGNIWSTNNTFSANVTVNGDTTIGNEAADKLVVNAGSTFKNSIAVQNGSTDKATIAYNTGDIWTAGNLQVDGNTTLGNAEASDTLTVNAKTAINGDTISLGNAATDILTVNANTIFKDDVRMDNAKMFTMNSGNGTVPQLTLNGSNGAISIYDSNGNAPVAVMNRVNNTNGQLTLSRYNTVSADTTSMVNAQSTADGSYLALNNNYGKDGIKFVNAGTTPAGTMSMYAGGSDSVNPTLMVEMKSTTDGGSLKLTDGTSLKNEQTKNTITLTNSANKQAVNILTEADDTGTIITKDAAGTPVNTINKEGMTIANAKKLVMGTNDYAEDTGSNIANRNTIEFNGRWMDTFSKDDDLYFNDQYGDNQTIASTKTLAKALGSLAPDATSEDKTNYLFDTEFGRDNNTVAENLIRIDQKIDTWTDRYSNITTSTKVNDATDSAGAYNPQPTIGDTFEAIDKAIGTIARGSYVGPYNGTDDSTSIAGNINKLDRQLAETDANMRTNRNNLNTLRSEMGYRNRLDTSNKNLTFGSTTSPASLVDAINNLSYSVGLIHGLANSNGRVNSSTSTVGTRTNLNYQAKTVSEQLVALDNAIDNAKTRIGTNENAIGRVGDLITGNYVNSSTNLTDAVLVLDGQIRNNANHIGDLSSLSGKAAGMTNLVSAINAVDSGLTTEVNRAKGVENTLNTSIETERTRATNAETNLRTAINNEANRAKRVEGDLDYLQVDIEAGLDKNLVNAINAVNTSVSDLSSSISTMGGGIGDLSALTHNAISDKSKVTNAVNSLATNVATGMGGSFSVTGKWTATATTYLESKTVDSIMGAVNHVSDAIGTVADFGSTPANGLSASNTVNKNLTALSSAISAETRRAKREEAVLTEAIDYETTRATGAEATLQGAITAEENRAKAIEGSLTNLSGHATGKENLVAAINAVDQVIYGEVERALGVEANLRTSISNEVTRAREAEEENAGAISAEATRATQAETNISNNLNTLGTYVGNRSDMSQKAISDTSSVSKAVNSLAKNVTTGMGGSFDNSGVWSGSVQTYKDASPVAVSSVMGAVEHVVDVIGTTTDLGYSATDPSITPKNGVSKDKTVNANISALNKAIGNVGLFKEDTYNNVAKNATDVVDAIAKLDNYVSNIGDISGDLSALTHPAISTGSRSKVTTAINSLATNVANGMGGSFTEGSGVWSGSVKTYRDTAPHAIDSIMDGVKYVADTIGTAAELGHTGSSTPINGVSTSNTVNANINAVNEKLGDVAIFSGSYVGAAKDAASAVAAISAIDTALSGEISRATTAEGSLQNNIDAVDDRVDDINTDVTNLHTKVGNMGIGMGGTLSDTGEWSGSVKTYKDASPVAVSSIMGAVNHVVGVIGTAAELGTGNGVSASQTVNKNIGAVSSALSEEITRATAKENTLTTGLENEVTRATAKETALTNSITEVDNRVTNLNTSVSNLNTKINNVGSGMGGDFDSTTGEWSGSVKTYKDANPVEVSTVMGAVNHVVGVIGTAAELGTTNGVSASQTVNKNIGTLSSKLGDIATFSGSYVGAAKNANSAVAAISAVDTALSGEISRATAAEGTLQDNIDAVDDRVDGVSTDVTNLNTKVSNIGAGLGGNVSSTGVWSGSIQTYKDEDPVAVSSVMGAVEHVVGVIGTAAELGTANGVSASQTVNKNIGALSNALSGEISRATSAESAIAGDLADEITRASAVESNLQTSIDTVDSSLTTVKNKVNGLNTKVNNMGTAFGGTLSATGEWSGSVQTYRDTTAKNVTTIMGAVNHVVSTLGTAAELGTANGVSASYTVNKNIGTVSNALKSEIDRAVAAEGTLQDNIDTVDGKITNVSTNVTNLSTKVDNIGAGLGGTLSATGEWSGSIQTYKDASPVAVSSVMGAVNHVVGVIGTAAELGTANGVSAEKTVNANIGALSSALSDEIDRATTAEGTLQNNINTVTSTVNTLNTTVSDLSDSYTTLNTNVTNLGNSYNTLNTTVTNLGNLVGTGSFTHNAISDKTTISGAVNSLAANVATGMGGSFNDSGVWSATIADNNTVNYGRLVGTTSITSVLSQLTSNIGTALHLGYSATDPSVTPKNGLSRDNTVNQNLAMLNTAIGDVSRFKAADYTGGSAIDATNLVDAIESVDAAVKDLVISSGGETGQLIVELHQEINRAKGAEQTLGDNITIIDNKVGDMADLTNNAISDTSTVIKAIDSLADNVTAGMGGNFDSTSGEWSGSVQTYKDASPVAVSSVMGAVEHVVDVIGTAAELGTANGVSAEKTVNANIGALSSALSGVISDMENDYATKVEVHGDNDASTVDTVKIGDKAAKTEIGTATTGIKVDTTDDGKKVEVNADTIELGEKITVNGSTGETQFGTTTSGVKISGGAVEATGNVKAAGLVLTNNTETPVSKVDAGTVIRSGAADTMATTATVFATVGDAAGLTTGNFDGSGNTVADKLSVLNEAIGDVSDLEVTLDSGDDKNVVNSVNKLNELTLAAGDDITHIKTGMGGSFDATTGVWSGSVQTYKDANPVAVSSVMGAVEHVVDVIGTAAELGTANGVSAEKTVNANIGALSSALSEAISDMENDYATKAEVHGDNDASTVDTVSIGNLAAKTEIGTATTGIKVDATANDKISVIADTIELGDKVTIDGSTGETQFGTTTNGVKISGGAVEASGNVKAAGLILTNNTSAPVSKVDAGTVIRSGAADTMATTATVFATVGDAAGLTTGNFAGSGNTVAAKLTALSGAIDSKGDDITNLNTKITNITSGGTFDTAGAWSGSVSTYKENTTVHNILEAAGAVSNTIGTAVDLGYDAGDASVVPVNGVSKDKTVNANIAAVNEAVGDTSDLEVTLDSGDDKNVVNSVNKLNELTLAAGDDITHIKTGMGGTFNATTGVWSDSIQTYKDANPVAVSSIMGAVNHVVGVIGTAAELGTANGVSAEKTVNANIGALSSALSNAVSNMESDYATKAEVHGDNDASTVDTVRVGNLAAKTEIGTATAGIKVDATSNKKVEVVGDTIKLGDQVTVNKEEGSTSFSGDLNVAGKTILSSADNGGLSFGTETTTAKSIVNAISGNGSATALVTSKAVADYVGKGNLKLTINGVEKAVFSANAGSDVAIDLGSYVTQAMAKPDDEITTAEDVVIITDSANVKANLTSMANVVKSSADKIASAVDTAAEVKAKIGSVYVNDGELITSGAVRNYVKETDDKVVHLDGAENITGSKTFKALQQFEKIIASGDDEGTYTTNVDGKTFTMNNGNDAKITLDAKNGTAIFAGKLNANGGTETTTLTASGLTQLSGGAEGGLRFGTGGQTVKSIVNEVTATDDEVLQSQLVTAKAVKNVVDSIAVETGDRVIVSDNSRKMVSSDITVTQLNQLSGIDTTKTIQTQLDERMKTSDWTTTQSGSDLKFIDGSKIASGSVDVAQLAAEAVTTAKIADENVTKDKLALAVQGSLNKADSAVQNVKLNGTALDKDANNAVNIEAVTTSEGITEKDSEDHYVNDGKLLTSGAVREFISGVGGGMVLRTGDTMTGELIINNGVATAESLATSGYIKAAGGIKIDAEGKVMTGTYSNAIELTGGDGGSDQKLATTKAVAATVYNKSKDGTYSFGTGTDKYISSDDDTTIGGAIDSLNKGLKTVSSSAVTTVKVNGDTLDKDNNAVDILITEGTTSGTISVNNKPVAVHNVVTTDTAQNIEATKTFKVNQKFAKTEMVEIEEVLTPVTYETDIDGKTLKMGKASGAGIDAMITLNANDGTSSFDGLMSANGGINTTTLEASGLMSANGGINTTTLTASDRIYANNGLTIKDGKQLKLNGAELTTVLKGDNTDLTYDDNAIATSNVIKRAIDTATDGLASEDWVLGNNGAQKAKFSAEGTTATNVLVDGTERNIGKAINFLGQQTKTIKDKIGSDNDLGYDPDDATVIPANGVSKNNSINANIAKVNESVGDVSKLTVALDTGVDKNVVNSINKIDEVLQNTKTALETDYVTRVEVRGDNDASTVDTVKIGDKAAKTEIGTAETGITVDTTAAGNNVQVTADTVKLGNKVTVNGSTGETLFGTTTSGVKISGGTVEATGNVKTGGLVLTNNTETPVSKVDAGTAALTAGAADTMATTATVFATVGNVAGLNTGNFGDGTTVASKLSDLNEAIGNKSTLGDDASKGISSRGNLSGAIASLADNVSAGMGGAFDDDTGVWSDTIKTYHDNADVNVSSIMSAVKHVAAVYGTDVELGYDPNDDTVIPLNGIRKENTVNANIAALNGVLGDVDSFKASRGYTGNAKNAANAVDAITKVDDALVREINRAQKVEGSIDNLDSDLGLVGDGKNLVNAINKVNETVKTIDGNYLSKKELHGDDSAGDVVYVGDKADATVIGTAETGITVDTTATGKKVEVNADTIKLGDKVTVNGSTGETQFGTTTDGVKISGGTVETTGNVKTGGLVLTDNAANPVTKVDAGSVVVSGATDTMATTATVFATVGNVAGLNTGNFSDSGNTVASKLSDLNNAIGDKSVLGNNASKGISNREDLTHAVASLAENVNRGMGGSFNSSTGKWSAKMSTYYKGTITVSNLMQAVGYVSDTIGTVEDLGYDDTDPSGPIVPANGVSKAKTVNANIATINKSVGDLNDLEVVLDEGVAKNVVNAVNKVNSQLDGINNNIDNVKQSMGGSFNDGVWTADISTYKETRRVHNVVDAFDVVSDTIGTAEDLTSGPQKELSVNNTVNQNLRALSNAIEDAKQSIIGDYITEEELHGSGVPGSSDEIKVGDLADKTTIGTGAAGIATNTTDKQVEIHADTIKLGSTVAVDDNNGAVTIGSGSKKVEIKDGTVTASGIKVGGKAINKIDTGSVITNKNASANTLATTATVAATMASAMGGEIDPDTGKWSTTAKTYLREVDVTSFMEAVDNVSYTIGTSAQLGSEMNGVSDKNTVNTNIAAVNSTIGNLKNLAKDLKNLTNGSKDEGYQPKDVVEVFNNIDSTLGKIHYLANTDGTVSSTRVVSTVGNGTNLAVGTTVEDHLVSLDNAIGNRNYTSTNIVTKGSSASAAISALDKSLGSSKDLGPSMNGVAAGNSVNTNIAAVNAAIGDVSRLQKETYLLNKATSMTDAVVSLDNQLYNMGAAIGEVAHRIDDVRKEMRSGLASAAALSALVPNARSDGKTSLSLGMGGYSGYQAVAVGGFHYVTDNLLLNVGASMGNGSDATYRIGATYTF